MTLKILLLTFLCGITSAQSDEVRVVQTTPIELTEFGVTFEKLDFIFDRPVSARFWIESDEEKGQPLQISEVPRDRVLPTAHYAMSYIQVDQQVALSVTTDSEPPLNRRTTETGFGDTSGTRMVTALHTFGSVELNQDIDLFVCTIRPPWRQPKKPVQVYKIRCRFSEGEYPDVAVDPEGVSHWKNSAGPVEILHSKTGLPPWLDVSTAVLRKSGADRMDFNALDGREAWLAINTQDKNRAVILIEHTSDGGKHWDESVAPVEAASAKLSFVDRRRGFLLALGDPSAGLMKKELLGTTDGGAHWSPLTAPGDEGQSFYPNGIHFRTPLEGWITATYHGAPDVPFFVTQDGGRSWKQQPLEIPADFQSGYADTYPPFFLPKFVNPENKKGKLPVHLVRHEPEPDHEAWVYYTTEDGGATWQPPKP